MLLTGIGVIGVLPSASDRLAHHAEEVAAQDLLFRILLAVASLEQRGREERQSLPMPT